MEIDLGKVGLAGKAESAGVGAWGLVTIRIVGVDLVDCAVGAQQTRLKR